MIDQTGGVDAAVALRFPSATVIDTTAMPGVAAPWSPPADDGSYPRRSRLHRSTFAEAAAQLADAHPHSEEARHWGRVAAETLLRLSEACDEDALREVLRPDPISDAVTWTVACYQIGDLTPTAMRDFSDPVAAVSMLACCPDRSHVAAELVASTDTELRWPALVRTGDVVAFQLFSKVGAGGDGADLDRALGRWEHRLSRWAARPEELAATPLFELSALTERPLLELGSGQAAPLIAPAASAPVTEAAALTQTAPAEAGGAAIDAAPGAMEVGIALGRILEVARNIDRQVEALTLEQARAGERLTHVDARIQQLEGGLPAPQPAPPSLLADLGPLATDALTLARDGLAVVDDVCIVAGKWLRRAMSRARVALAERAAEANRDRGRTDVPPPRR